MFSTVPNKKNVEIVGLNFSSDSTKDLDYIPPHPLPAKNFSLYVVGGVGSGKSSFWHSLTHSKGHKVRNSTKRHPRFYYKVFDKVYLMSCSLGTMDLDKIKIPKEQVFGDYSGEELQTIIDSEQESEENNNILFLLDDCIKSISKRNSQNQNTLHRMLINRRHCCVNNNSEKSGGCSAIITSQKFNLLPLSLRASGISHLVLFQSRNQKELRNVWEEYASDLSEYGFKKLLDFVWEDPKGHDFLFIIINERPENKYYRNFDKIDIPDIYFS